ncbi:unnamed protein product [Cuscuta europaea]|uniref:Uncharacterized protein n=1 Tax=Cuscuta europaea TaxID=41803 RepID=A0A9P0YWQ7_CUSEU|nr:unnamed protein product [Cuscuta europaea]
MEEEGGRTQREWTKLKKLLPDQNQDNKGVGHTEPFTDEEKKVSLRSLFEQSYVSKKPYTDKDTKHIPFHGLEAKVNKLLPTRIKITKMRGTQNHIQMKKKIYFFLEYIITSAMGNFFMHDLSLKAFDFLTYCLCYFEIATRALACYR